MFSSDQRETESFNDEDKQAGRRARCFEGVVRMMGHFFGGVFLICLGMFFGILIFRASFRVCRGAWLALRVGFGVTGLIRLCSRGGCGIRRGRSIEIVGNLRKCIFHRVDEDITGNRCHRKSFL